MTVRSNSGVRGARGWRIEDRKGRKLSALRARLPAFCRREDGSAGVVVFALLVIMLMLAAANVKVLRHLHQDLKLMERRQMQRLDPGSTNASGGTGSASAENGSWKLERTPVPAFPTATRTNAP